jgi:hypothetical protein
VELVSVVEDGAGSPRGSRTSVVGRRNRRGSLRAGEDVYIERERVRLSPGPRERDEYDTYRYVPAPRNEPSPRMSTRTVERERERVYIEDGGRRREYYRRG